VGNEYREVEAQTVERHRCGLFLQTEFRGLSACVSGCFTIVTPETTSEPIVVMFRAFHKEPCVRWGTNPPKIKGTGIFKRDMLGHARRCPTTDILKVTHKGQRAVDAACSPSSLWPLVVVCEPHSKVVGATSRGSF